MKRLALAVVLVISLAGCSAVLGPSKYQLALADQLGNELSSLPGVEDAWASYSAGLDQGDDLNAHVTVSVTVDAKALPALAASVRDAVDEAGFTSSNRSVDFTFTDGSTMSWFASHREDLSIDTQLSFFVRWWSDPRVAKITDKYGVTVDLDPAAVDPTAVGAIYSEIADAAGDVAGDASVVVNLPDGLRLMSERYRFTPDRLAMALEVAALPALTTCGVSAYSYTSGTYQFDVACVLAAEATADEVGPLVNAILQHHDMLKNTKVRLNVSGQAAVVTNDVGTVTEPN